LKGRKMLKKVNHPGAGGGVREGGGEVREAAGARMQN